MSDYVLVKYHADYADEFDVYGFRVLTRSKWAEIVEDVRNTWDGPTETYFGTNEFVEYEDFDDWFRDFKVTEISEEEFKVFEKFFKGVWIFSNS